ncbi:MAG: EAL domain-containing protein [Evtepia sp.]
MNKSLSKNYNIYALAISTFLLMSLFVGFLCFKYYTHLQTTVETETGDYMTEIASQMEINVSRTIDHNFSILNTIATLLQTSNLSNDSELSQLDTAFDLTLNDHEIVLIDENGIAHDQFGNALNLINDTYLQDVIVSRKCSMSPSQLIGGKESIIFAVPLDNIQIGSVKMSALAGIYDANTFDQILSIDAFHGEGYAHIIKKDGSVVVRSSSPSALPLGYNILNSICSAKLQNPDALRRAIEQDETGRIEFTLNGNRQYMTYTPLSARDWCLLTFVPVSVVNEKSTLLLRVTLLMSGFITLSFAILFTTLLVLFFRSKRKLEQLAFVDPITGGHTINRFYELVPMLLANHAPYALIYSNIEKFKVLNEQFGRTSCDQILRSIQVGISSNLASDECMGRLFADNFCILIRYIDEKSLVNRLSTWQDKSATYLDSLGVAQLPMCIEFGIFIVSDPDIPITHMIDRAKLSISEAKKYGGIHYAFYDEKLRQTLLREKYLEDRMNEAIQNAEFVVFLQPKFHTDSETIGGAEALVRWKSPVDGMIYPDEFIPLFEKNGFITQLDCFVFEETCRTLHRWSNR